MYFITFLITFILLILIILYIFPVKIAGNFNSELKSSMSIIITWLSPFLKVYIKNHNNTFIFTLLIFSKEIFSKDFLNSNNSKEKQSNRNYTNYLKWLRLLHIEDSKLYASYCFDDPSVTGILFSTINTFSQHINLDDFINNADFSPLNNYFNLSFAFKINIILSLLIILKSKLPNYQFHAFSER